MKQYKVEISKIALADMESIYNYIAENFLSPDTAMKQYNRIADKILLLNSFPETYPLFQSKLERDLGMRRMTVDNFTVIFVVIDDIVTVIRVLYSASDIIARLRDNELS